MVGFYGIEACDLIKDEKVFAYLCPLGMAEIYVHYTINKDLYPLYFIYHIKR